MAYDGFQLAIGFSQELRRPFGDVAVACPVELESFAYRVAKYVGAYAAAMNGVDVIAFTAGIGENAPMIREKVMGYL